MTGYIFRRPAGKQLEVGRFVELERNFTRQIGLDWIMNAIHWRARCLKAGVAIGALAILLIGVRAWDAEAARLDPTFGNNGTVVVNHGGSLQFRFWTGVNFGEASALAIDPQGRILVGGGSGASFLVMRFLPDGTLDPSFGEGGEVRMYAQHESTDPAESAPRVKDILVRDDGTIVLVGMSLDASPCCVLADLVLFRLNDDGSINSDFGRNGDGYVRGHDDGDTLFPSEPFSAAFTAGQKVLVSGTAETAMDDWGTPTRYTGFVARRNSDGWSDPAYGGNKKPDMGTAFPGTYLFGTPPKGIGVYAAGTSVLALPHGKALIGGYYHNQLMVLRLNRAGMPDHSFGADHRFGRTIARFGGARCHCATGGAIIRDRRKRIVQVGSRVDLSGEIVVPRKTLMLVRYRRDGRIDRSFGRKGFAVYREAGSWIMATSIAMQRGGRFLVTASMEGDTPRRLLLYRFHRNGKIDRSFFDNGRYSWKRGNGSIATKVILDQRGRALVAGGAGFDGTGSFVLKRFLVGR